ncbi:MAG TPA: hypothetical protein VIN59_10030 [Alphaproteobacteria bacterium]
MKIRYLNSLEVDAHVKAHGGADVFFPKLRALFTELTGIEPNANGFKMRGRNRDIDILMFGPKHANTLAQLAREINPQFKGFYVRFGVHPIELNTAREIFNNRSKDHPINALLPEGVPVRVEAEEPIFINNAQGDLPASQTMRLQ